MALREFKNAGLNPYDDFKEIRFGNTHQAVVMDVLARKVDAGTVRSGILEKLASEKKINLNDLRVINKQTNICSFKILHSTFDYPEWPIARLKNTDCDLRIIEDILYCFSEGDYCAIVCRYIVFTYNVFPAFHLYTS